MRRCRSCGGQRDKACYSWEAMFSQAFFVASEGVDAVVCYDSGCINAISIFSWLPPLQIANKCVFSNPVCRLNVWMLIALMWAVIVRWVLPNIVLEQHGPSAPVSFLRHFWRRCCCLESMQSKYRSEHCTNTKMLTLPKCYILSQHIIHRWSSATLLSWLKCLIIVLQQGWKLSLLVYCIVLILPGTFINRLQRWNIELVESKLLGSSGHM